MKYKLLSIISFLILLGCVERESTKKQLTEVVEHLVSGEDYNWIDCFHEDVIDRIRELDAVLFLEKFPKFFAASNSDRDVIDISIVKNVEFFEPDNMNSSVKRILDTYDNVNFPVYSTYFRVKTGENNFVSFNVYYVQENGRIKLLLDPDYHEDYVQSEQFEWYKKTVRQIKDGEIEIEGNGVMWQE